LLTWRASALRDPAATAEEVSEAGRRLALVLGVLAVVSALASLGADRVEARLRPFRRSSWLLPAALAGALLFVVVVAAARADRPLGPRIDYWRVAWAEWEDNAWLGSGAGTFARFWEREAEPVDVQDAHSIYVETLAELGPVGLALLVCALGIPVVAAVKARGHLLLGVGASGYVAYLVHAGLDWDWEMPAVTLTGLLCGVALLAAARSRERELVLGPGGRAGFGLAALAVAALAIGLRIAG
jgi:O-antigen ligase